MFFPKKVDFAKKKVKKANQRSGTSGDGNKKNETLSHLVLVAGPGLEPGTS